MPRKNVHRFRRRRFRFGQIHLALVGFLVLGGLIIADEVRKASEIKGITGPVRGVRDGDTILVKGVPIRLNGVDAPELGTRAGNAAKVWMQDYLGEQVVSCTLNGRRTYDRWVGDCYLREVDIAVAIISAGHALDCRRYSGGRYRRFETRSARSNIRRADYC